MLMAECTKENSRTVRGMVEECLDMLMAKCTKENSRTVIIMVEECVDMLIATCKKENTRTVRGMVEECLDILTALFFMMASGRTINQYMAHNKNSVLSSGDTIIKLSSN